MNKRVKLLLLAIVLVLMGTNLAASWGPLPAYNTTLYSDATYQIVVGYIYPECHPYYGIWYHLSGTYSQYGIDQYVGTCVDGEMTYP
jgi:hypothetical protein